MDNHILEEMAIQSQSKRIADMGVGIAQMSQIHLKEPEKEAIRFRSGPANLYLSIKEPLFSTFSV